MQRVLLGKPAQSQIVLGLRGVGKTVLLNRIEREAENLAYLTSGLGAPGHRPLAELLYPQIHQVLRKLSLVEAARSEAHAAYAALRSFAGAFRIDVGGFEIAADPEIGVADSGHLEFDLAEIVVRIGEAARSAGRGWVLLIDEIQCLGPDELAALVLAMHRSDQKRLPVLVFGAGLPGIATLAGDAKSHAERLFTFPRIDALEPDDARQAIRQPIEAEGETVSPAALEHIVRLTRGYPHFLQEWGFQIWNASPSSPVGQGCLGEAGQRALSRLDERYFKVRFDQLTPKEKDYVIAMARLGPGPYRSSEVADALGEKLSTLGPRRAQILAKGLIYSPAYGDIAFTIPMFDEYLKRHWIT